MTDDQSATKPEEKLLAEFSFPTYEEWKQEAVDSLKGAPFEKTLLTMTYEGIELKPLYGQEDSNNLPHLGSLPGFPPFVRGTEAAGYLAKPWAVSQTVPSTTPQEFNRTARYDLERGQTALKIIPDRPTRLGLDPKDAETGQVGAGGVSLATPDDFRTALEGIEPSKTPLYIFTGAAALPLAALLAASLEEQGKSASTLSGCLGADPLGELAGEGALPFSIETAYDLMASLALWAKDSAPGCQTILVSGHPYHDAGGSATQELAYALAAGVEYIRALLNRGLEIDDIAARILFAFSIGSNFFMEMAKLRAARLLWCNVIEVFGGGEASQKMKIHGRTSAWTKTVYDPYVNMLRNTTEALAGVAAGVDSLDVACFDEPIRPPEEFSRRVSRNVQVLLRNESHLTQPIDPGGGSWYLEVLTDQVAKKAWSVFQEVEAKGGMLKALEEGVPQAAVAEVAAKKAVNLGTRWDVMVGINMYPNLGEKPLEVTEIDFDRIQKERVAQVQAFRDKKGGTGEAIKGLTVEAGKPSAGLMEKAMAAAGKGATLGDLTAALAGGDPSRPLVKPLPRRRAAEMYESLRKNADMYLAETGSRPKVFLANMGPIPQHKPRADFSTGFFQVGGFEVLTNDGFKTVEQAAGAAGDSGAPIVV
ncbi:MAG: methylmalonyl-CoA mutase family protein, partial [Pseudomonadota bacterium]